jgi:alpha-beta hydrolase superfamily lysophospholipase
VYASDHRGHGRTARTVDNAGIVGPDGWNRMLADELLLTETVAAAHPGAPVVLLGHSMGSLLGQAYAQQNGAALAGLILSGTASSLPVGAEDLAERVAAAVESEGPEAPSMDFANLFAEFNEPFLDSGPPSGPTGFEWLSRDPVEVARYVDDPFCGFMFCNGLVLDMARGLEEIWAPGAEGRIPSNLPILLIAGQEDPVGVDGGVHRLGDRYRAAGLDVTEILYPNARHEIFNETNLDEVHRDVLAWLLPRFGNR